MRNRRRLKSMLKRLAELDDKYHVGGLNEQEYREYLALLENIKRKVR